MNWKIFRLLLALAYAISHFVFLVLAIMSANDGHYDVAAYQIGVAIVFCLWADESTRSAKESRS